MKKLQKLLGLLLAALLFIPAIAVTAADPDPDAVGSYVSDSVTALDVDAFAEEYLDYPEEAYEDVDFDAIKIPYLVPDEGFFAEVNELIRDSVLEMLEPFADDETFYIASSYEVLDLGDLISIRHSMHDPVAMQHPHVYVIDVENEELWDNEAVAASYGIPPEEVEAYILQTLWDAAILHGESLPEQEEFNVSSFFTGQTLNYYYDNPDSAQLYIDKNGELALSCFIFTPAGSGFMTTSMRVRVTPYEPDRLNSAFIALGRFTDLSDYDGETLPVFVADSAEGYLEEEDYAFIEYNLNLINYSLNEQYDIKPPVLRSYDPYALGEEWEDLDIEELNETFLCVVPPDKFTTFQLWDLDNDMPFGSPDIASGMCFISLADFDSVGDEPFQNIGLRVRTPDIDDIYEIYDPDGDSLFSFVETDVDAIMGNKQLETETVIHSDFAEDYEDLLTEYGFEDLIVHPEGRYYNLPVFARDDGDFADVNEELEELQEMLLDAVEEACEEEAENDTGGMDVIPNVMYSVYEDPGIVSLYLYVYHAKLEQNIFRIYTLDKDDNILLNDEDILGFFGQLPEDRLPILALSVINFSNELGRAFGADGFYGYASHLAATGLTDLYNIYDEDENYFYIYPDGELALHIPPKPEGAPGLIFSMIPAYYEAGISEFDSPLFILMTLILDIHYADYDLIVANIGSLDYDDYPDDTGDLFLDANLFKEYEGSRTPLLTDRAILAGTDPESYDLNVSGEGDYYIVIAKKMQSVLAYVASESGLDPAWDIEHMQSSNYIGWFGTGVDRAIFILPKDDPDAHLFWRCGDDMMHIYFDDLPDNVYDMTDELADFPDARYSTDWILEEFIQAALAVG